MLAQARSNASGSSFQQVGMLRPAAPACTHMPMSTHERRLEALRARAAGRSQHQAEQSAAAAEQSWWPDDPRTRPTPGFLRRPI